MNLFSGEKEEKTLNCSGDYNKSFVYMLIAQINYFIFPFILLCLLNILIMFNIWKRTRKMKHFRIIQTSKNFSQNNSLEINTRKSSHLHQYSTILSNRYSNQQIL